MRTPLLILSVLLIGCSSRPSTPQPTFSIAPGDYPAAFAAAREALIQQRFELERIDAAAGILSTIPKGSAGLATPWSSDAGSVEESLQDFGASHWRAARITFEPQAPAARPPVGTPGSGFSESTDLRHSSEPLIATVQVFVYERHKPNRRLESESIRRSSFFQDPDLLTRGIQPTHLTPLRQDTDLAARIAVNIRLRLPG